MWISSHLFCFSGKQRAARRCAQGARSASGFTLIELLIVITIITVLTAVFLFQQKKFDSATLLRSLAYNIALSVRQAQVYGTSVREFNGTFKNNYGISFSAGDTHQYVLFADKNGDGRYEGPSDPPPDETVQTFTINSKFHISDICADTSCVTNGQITWLTILFKRPNPDAIFKSSAGGSYSTASVQVTGSGGNTRTITITSPGQISVGESGS